MSPQLKTGNQNWYTSTMPWEPTDTQSGRLHLHHPEQKDHLTRTTTHEDLSWVYHTWQYYQNSLAGFFSFHTSAGIPSPPDVLPSFKPALALTISAMVRISSRLVLVMRCGMLSRASWSMSPGTLISLWKCSLHLATTLLLSEKVSITSVDFRWTGPFVLGPHTSFSPL